MSRPSYSAKIPSQHFKRPVVVRRQASPLAFFYVVYRREKTYPASQQPRQLDHPLVPPRHSDNSSTIAKEQQPTNTKKD
ncbi:hypothetical protein PLICRDRAFT_176337 [Plicaturopsis crispa FD-325 SS-3]|nr:hypothetical protein PLICRDRAFT_176337 [Plicaturopsis crispa FD-325 SS-3]